MKMNKFAINKFTNDVLKTIDRHKMIAKGAVVIAAVSGGYDSVCMLHVLSRLTRLRGFSLCAAHLNHGLRPEADDDELFVKELCKNMGIVSYTKKVFVEQYAKERKISFETAGREIRYEFFDNLMESIEGSVTATAHNANDNAESFTMHLLRGCGLTGLTGIKAVRGGIIRPLIERTRDEIERYCKENSLEIRIDSTNEDDKYTRNDIRHNVMPAIIERGGLRAVTRTAEILSADEDFLEQCAKSAAEQLITKKNNMCIINAQEFNRLHIAVKRRLMRMAAEIAGSTETGLTHIDNAISVAERNHGGKRAELPGGASVKLENGKIIIFRGVEGCDK